MRKFREKSTLGGLKDWEFLVGEPVKVFNPEKDMLAESSANPVFLRKDTENCCCWRIRNLPYPAEVYSVNIDDEKQDIVVRTSNKKYYKRIQVSDVVNRGEKLTVPRLRWRHEHNTLIIEYTKSEEHLAAEQAAAIERRQIKTTSTAGGGGGGAPQKDGEVDCKQQ